MENQSAIVIENSADCNLKCPACPTRHTTSYPGQYMEDDIFERILGNISPKLYPNCALMGWGEPLLDPSYFQKLLSLKKLGFYVGSTTNGTLLTEKMIAGIIDHGLDQLGISLDANHLNDRLSYGEFIDDKIRSLLNIKEKKRGSVKINISIVVFRSKKDSVIQIIDGLKDFPIDGISLIPITMIPTKSLYSELIFRHELRDLQLQVSRCFPNMPISFQYLEEEMQGNCRSDIFHNVYVDYQGNVSPCCILAMPFPNMTFDGTMRHTEYLRFGNLTGSHIESIWSSQAYSEFRNIYYHNHIPDICQCCNAWRMLPEEYEEPVTTSL